MGCNGIFGRFAILTFIHSRMAIPLFFLLIDFFPLFIFLWFFHHLTTKEQLVSLSPVLFQLIVLSIAALLSGDDLLVAFAFGLGIPFLLLNIITLAGAFSAAYCYRWGWKSSAKVVVCATFAFMLMSAVLFAK